MARGRRRRDESPEAGVAAVYEGPEVLSALLARAGSPLEAAEVAERFAAAQAAGESRAETIPGLFPEEPRFASPDDARRLYSNLFGLWGRVAAGLGPTDDAPEVAPPPPPPPPERGLHPPGPLEADFVELMWRHLAGLPEREVRRLHDRFQNGQPDLASWLDGVALPETGGLAAADLVFEAWAMFDQGFDDRLGRVAWKEIQVLEAEPPPLESEQPALASYVAEQLDNLADDEPGFGAAERAQVERVAAAAAAALGRAVAPEPGRNDA
ncbi:MAG TPA: hypothetical protein VFR85_15340 [Anaeromyxobacteraceae bacterium]|nr:hypothetical protein [Anaeromyxobacteraceae bacterium]